MFRKQFGPRLQNHSPSMVHIIMSKILANSAQPHPQDLLAKRGRPGDEAKLDNTHIIPLDKKIIDETLEPPFDQRINVAIILW